MHPPIIEVQNLSKSYRDIQAVSGLSFVVPEGEVYGFLGQNGAGKSTTIRMLLSLVEPSEGEIRIFGMNLKTNREAILRKTGAVIERPDLYKYLSAFENLSLFARMSGVKPSRPLLMEQLELVGLVHRANDKVKTYSQGMKQRLGIAVALVHDPRLVILDEPVNGLDPQGIADIRNLILHLSRHRGKTIFVSSHLLSEMELIADRMLIIDRGKKVAEGPIKELFDPSRMLVEVEATDTERLWTCLQASEWKAFLKEKRKDMILLQMNRQQVPALTEELVRGGIEILSITPRHSLEEYFLSLTTPNRHVDTFAD